MFNKPLSCSASRISVLLVLSTALPLSACISQIAPAHEQAQSWLGRSIEDYRRFPSSYMSRTGAREQQYRLPTGNTVVVTPLRPGCSIHWETDTTGTIVGYRL